MRRDWDLDDLITCWTLVDADRKLMANKYGPTLLGFCLMLKFFEIEGRFPRHAGEVPPAAVEFVAHQVKLEPAALAGYDFKGRSIKEHRAQIREALGFRVFSRGDEDKMVGWLAAEVCPSEGNPDRQRAAVLARCRVEKLEPPGRMDRIIASANRQADEAFCTATMGRLSSASIALLEDMLGPADDDAGDPDEEPVGEAGVEAAAAGGGVSFFNELKSDPGPLGLETLLAEISKLKRVRAVGLAESLFADVAERRLARWRARAVAEYPSTLRRDHSPKVRLTMLAVLCWCRQAEITDSLVDLFIDLVARINTRAERRVEKQMIAEFRRVGNKESVLFRMADAAVEHPDETVRAAVYPVVGEATLRDLVAEAKATEANRRARVRTVLTGSYSSYYRRMLPELLAALGFRCNNTAYRPVMQAVELLERYSDRDGRLTQYDQADRVPLLGVVKADWRDAVVDEKGRVTRTPYELCALGALREAIRRREIWVEGAGRWRNPDTDLPHDFDLNRDVHYTAIRQPDDPTAFVDALRERLDTALARCAEAIRGDTAGGVRVGTRKGQVWITVPRPVAQPVPQHLGELKTEVIRRWGMIGLLDILKEADYLTGLHTEFASAASREHLEPAELRRRILLVLFGLGTNIGIRRITASGDHQVSEAQLRRVRRLFVNRDGMRRAIAAVVNTTLRERDARWWGAGTACASDSKKFGSWESNLMTEWHARYGGPGVMIYWHVERKSVCVYSQLKTCSSSEVAAMMEGLIRHAADVDASQIEANYTDTHGASVVGFAFTHLLGYRLLPRLKNIGGARLYRPGDGAAYPGWRRC